MNKESTIIRLEQLIDHMASGLTPIEISSVILGSKVKIKQNNGKLPNFLCKSVDLYSEQGSFIRYLKTLEMKENFSHSFIIKKTGTIAKMNANIITYTTTDHYTAVNLLFFKGYISAIIFDSVSDSKAISHIADLLEEAFENKFTITSYFTSRINTNRIDNIPIQLDSINCMFFSIYHVLKNDIIKLANKKLSDDIILKVKREKNIRVSFDISEFKVGMEKLLKQFQFLQNTDSGQIENMRRFQKIPIDILNQKSFSKNTKSLKDVLYGIQDVDDIDDDTDYLLLDPSLMKQTRKKYLNQSIKYLKNLDNSINLENHFFEFRLPS